MSPLCRDVIRRNCSAAWLSGQHWYELGRRVVRSECRGIGPIRRVVDLVYWSASDVQAFGLASAWSLSRCHHWGCVHRSTVAIFACNENS